MHDSISKTNDLEKVIFYCKNEVTRSYKWIDDSPEKIYEHRYGYWECQNADSWDNCTNIDWVKYNERRKANEDKM